MSLIFCPSCVPFCLILLIFPLFTTSQVVLWYFPHSHSLTYPIIHLLTPVNHLMFCLLPLPSFPYLFSLIKHLSTPCSPPHMLSPATSIPAMSFPASLNTFLPPVHHLMYCPASSLPVSTCTNACLPLHSLQKERGTAKPPRPAACAQEATTGFHGLTTSYAASYF